LFLQEQIKDIIIIIISIQSIQFRRQALSPQQEDRVTVLTRQAHRVGLARGQRRRPLDLSLGLLDLPSSLKTRKESRTLRSKCSDSSSPFLDFSGENTPSTLGATGSRSSSKISSVSRRTTKISTGSLRWIIQYGKPPNDPISWTNCKDILHATAAYAATPTIATYLTAIKRQATEHIASTKFTVDRGKGKHFKAAYSAEALCWM
jgi:hypothetical protein